MPKMLLALVTISVWILFVVGCLGLLMGFVGLAMFRRRLEDDCRFWLRCIQPYAVGNSRLVQKPAWLK